MAWSLAIRVSLLCAATVAVLFASAAVDLEYNNLAKSTVVPKRHSLMHMNPEYSPHVLPYWFMMEKLKKERSQKNVIPRDKMPKIKHSQKCPQGTDRSLPCEESTVYALIPGEQGDIATDQEGGPFTMDVQHIPMPNLEDIEMAQKAAEAAAAALGPPPQDMSLMDPSILFSSMPDSVPPEFSQNPTSWIQTMMAAMDPTGSLFRQTSSEVEATGEVPKDLDWMLRGPENLDYNELENFLLQLTRYFKDSTRLEVVGETVQNRTIYAVVLCYNKLDCRTRPMLKPKVRLAANFHGNHGTARALLTFLIMYLQLHREHNPRVQALLQKVEIHIIPTVNPDGYEQALEDWERLRRYSNISEGFYNANGEDLEVDYPNIWKFSHFSQPGFWDEREPETIALMKYSMEELFVMSGVFSDGDLVVRLPLWSHQQRNFSDTGVESRPPDYDVFMQIGHEYAFRHPVMNAKEFLCPKGRTHFFDGVENGAFGHIVEPPKGHSADWHYKFANAFEWTIYISCYTMSMEETLDVDWTRNVNSMIAFVESARMGAQGMVWDNRTGSPISDAYIEVKNRRHRLRTNERGEYWRLLNDGVYSMRAVKRGYDPAPWAVVRIFNALGPVTQHFYLSQSVKSEGSGSFLC
ncbi:unnamed protein product [Notodromas monacha]|uniref:Peptidase M14 domain-containing protein n=1 Tax=Notodromas monacha TaxID=399045 RepID=A0A7R9GFA3_9CRUS|nr:unnamed protein product [Notodromas monacha]CAG0920488.1 unnamed protein product [Notodromas monacha]